MKLYKYLITFLIMILFSGCGGNCCEESTTILSPTASNIAPESIITGLYDQNITVGDSITINGNSSLDSDGNIQNFTWTINNDTISTDENVTHKFNTTGINQVCLKVADNNNLIDETCKYVGVQPKESDLPPLAKLPIAQTSIISTNDATKVTDNKLDGDQNYNLSCEESYDQDTINTDSLNIDGINGDIVECLWTLGSYGYDEHKKTNCITHNSDGSWNFCSHAKYVEITLTVRDDENQTYTSTSTYSTYGYGEDWDK